MPFKMDSVQLGVLSAEIERLRQPKPVWALITKALQAADVGRPFCDVVVKPTIVVQVMYKNGRADSIRVGRRTQVTYGDMRALTRLEVLSGPPANTDRGLPRVKAWLGEVALRPAF